MICSWILNVIEPRLRSSVAYVKTAAAMWQDLQKWHRVANAPRIYQFKIGIADCKQGGLDVVGFYSKLMSLWSELNNHIKIPYCMCGAAVKIVKMFDEEKAYQFLMGLSDEMYGQIHSQILAQDPLPQLEKMFNIVVQEEQHKNLVTD